MVSGIIDGNLTCDDCVEMCYMCIIFTKYLTKFNTSFIETNNVYGQLYWISMVQHILRRAL